MNILLLRYTFPVKSFQFQSPSRRRITLEPVTSIVCLNMEHQLGDCTRANSSTALALARSQGY